jgi:hypothetical protein
VPGVAGVSGVVGVVGSGSSASNANLNSRSPGLHFSAVKNVLPGMQRQRLGFVTLGALRTWVACSNA